MSRSITDAGALLLPVLILVCIILSDAAKPPFQKIHQSRKLTNGEKEAFFPSSSYVTQLDAASGNIPIVNPTTPSTTLPPTTFMPPTTTAPPTTFMPPTTPTGNQGSLPPPTIIGSPTMPTTNPSPMPITNPTIGGGGGEMGGGGGSWCIASSNASPTSLQVALDYACGYGGADCSAIQQGSSCYEPNTLKDHASYAFNDYYQKNPNPTSCVFGGAAQLTNTDPSSGSCHFPSSGSGSARTPTTPPPMTPSTPMIPMTPPSTTTPVNPYTPSGPTGFGSEPTDYGSEPTGTPNSSEMSSYSLKLLMVMACLALWI